MPKESAKASTEQTVVISQEEYERLLAASQPATPSSEPAFEEGPHLKKADIRDAKRQQMVDAGLTVDSPDLTDDMIDILGEG